MTKPPTSFPASMVGNSPLSTLRPRTVTPTATPQDRTAPPPHRDERPEPVAPRQDLEPLVIATDGACKHNPGPGGWAWVADDAQFACGGDPRTTNNIMELAAIKEALKATQGQPERPVILQSDSAYSIDCLTKYIHGWRRSGWKKKDGTVPKNIDLIIEIDNLLRGRKVTFEKVKGHSGHPLNTAADLKAVYARDDADRTGVSNRFGPGLASA